MTGEPTERERWNARYTAADPSPRPVSGLLLAAAELLPRSGRAIDLAGGDGIEARWLAARGLDTTVVDVSDVALARAEALAAETGVTVRTVVADLAVDPLPPGPWDLIHIGHYLDRDLLRTAAATTAGWLVVDIATVVNLERHDRPGPRFLLEPGELEAIVTAADRLELVRSDEAWRPNDRHEAWLVARVRG